jgi:hypothetical protein
MKAFGGYGHSFHDCYVERFRVHPVVLVSNIRE